jgi:hypothetical protein
VERAVGTRSGRLGRWESKGREAGEIHERDEASNLLALHTQDSSTSRPSGKGPARSAPALVLTKDCWDRLMDMCLVVRIVSEYE